MLQITCFLYLRYIEEDIEKLENLLQGDVLVSHPIHEKRVSIEKSMWEFFEIAENSFWIESKYLNPLGVVTFLERKESFIQRTRKFQEIVGSKMN